MSVLRGPVIVAPSSRLQDGVWTQCRRAVPEETAISFVVDGAAEAVMMATPHDLEDFALGFALADGLISSLNEVRTLEFAESELGIEARLWLTQNARPALARRRRRRAGPVGCGLCGVESLADAMRPIAPVHSNLKVRADDIIAAMAALSPLQSLYQQTHAIHAAALYAPNESVGYVREDVGRHNALDKLVGALARDGRDARNAVVLLTSRVSIELIQKAALIGAPVIAAVSAPTALALRAAESAGISVCAIVRANGMEVFTHRDRITT